MGKLVLYGNEASPTVRACKLTLHALDLQYEYKLVNLLASEHKTKDFLRKNPQHTIPVLEDDGKYIWDSHAICAYLVRKYAKNDQLYPKEFYARAVVDQRLHFDSGVLFQGCLRTIAVPVFYKNVTEIPRSQIESIYEAYNFLEAFLSSSETNVYLAGRQLTLADFSCIATVSSLLGLAPAAAEKYPKLNGWMERMTKLPYYEQANGNGAQMLIDMFTSKIKKII